MRQKSEEKMNDIVKYIDAYFSINQSKPSLMSIANALGMSKTNVHRYMQDMCDRKIISYNDDGDFSTPKIDRIYNGLVSIALVGSIRCGVPALAEENIEDYFTLPKKMVGNSDCFLLRASGESMLDAGINDGDLVLIKSQNVAENGEIVVALCDDCDATLKRYYKGKNCVRLVAENEQFEDIIVDNCGIQGVAIKVIKDLH